MTCHLFKAVQFDFVDGNFIFVFRINYCHGLPLLRKNHHMLLKLINLTHQMFCKILLVGRLAANYSST